MRRRCRRPGDGERSRSDRGRCRRFRAAHRAGAPGLRLLSRPHPQGRARQAAHQREPGPVGSRSTDLHHSRRRAGHAHAAMAIAAQRGGSALDRRRVENRKPAMITRVALFALCMMLAAPAGAGEPRGTGDLGIVVERASGSVLIVDTSKRTALGRVEGLGDLSHASAVFSRDQRFAYVFGRDGGLTKVDLLTASIANRVMQGGNSVGGAISDDGTLVAVSNYEPGGVRIFDAETLAQVADLPAVGADGKASKTVGLVDVPGRRFAYALYDAGEIWIADFSQGANAVVTRLTGVGKLPYDGNVTPDGRHYLAGLFGEDGVVHVDLWGEPLRAVRILDKYGRGEEPLPVYKMPHLEGWAAAGDRLLIPAVGRHELLAVDLRSFKEVA